VPHKRLGISQRPYIHWPGLGSALLHGLKQWHPNQLDGHWRPAASDEGKTKHGRLQLILPSSHCNTVGCNRNDFDKKSRTRQ